VINIFVLLEMHLYQQQIHYMAADSLAITDGHHQATADGDDKATSYS